MLGDFLNQPVAVFLGNRHYMVRTLTLGDMAMITRNARIRAGIPDDSGFLTDQHWDWVLGGPENLSLLLWAMIRRDEPGFTIADAYRLAMSVDVGRDSGELRIILRTAQSCMAKHAGGDDEAAPLLPFGLGIRRLIRDHKLPVATIAESTLDQMSMVLRGTVPRVDCEETLEIASSSSITDYVPDDDDNPVSAPLD